MSASGNTAELTIATWNVYNRSTAPWKINSCNADIAAFQELTGAHFPYLSADVKTAEDFIEKGQVTYLGLLSKLPLLSCQRIALNPGRRVSPSFLGRRMRWVECLEALHLAYDWGGAPLSVVNLHLSCAVSMEQRRDELDRLLAAVDLAPRAVVLGDFNSFETGLIWPLLGPLTGARPKRIGFREVDDLSAHLCKQGFDRIQFQRPTLPRLKLTLDHIFYRGLTALSHEVARDTLGSDHRSLTARFTG
ncbi:MAG: endonuclease/exonuclease/phosphatase family protein [Kiloniellales bacterium]